MAYLTEHDIERSEQLRNPAGDRFSVVSVATSALEALAQLFEEEPVRADTVNRPVHPMEIAEPVRVPETSVMTDQITTYSNKPTPVKESAIVEQSEEYLVAQKAVDEAFLEMKQIEVSSN